MPLCLLPPQSCCAYSHRVSALGQFSLQEEVLPMESFSVAFWGVFFWAQVFTLVFVKVSLLWGTSWGGRQSSWPWEGWILGLVWGRLSKGLGAGSVGWGLWLDRQPVPSLPALPWVGDAVP